MYYRLPMAKDLQKIVTKLISVGYSEYELAELAGCSQPTIHRIKHGDTDPAYTVGKALEKLHDDRFKRPN